MELSSIDILVAHFLQPRYQTRGAHRARFLKIGLRVLVTVIERVLPALFIVYHEIDCDLCAVRPIGIWRKAPVASQITRGIFGEVVSS